jgi:hypothetical protein
MATCARALAKAQACAREHEGALGVEKHERLKALRS